MQRRRAFGIVAAALLGCALLIGGGVTSAAASTVVRHETHSATTYVETVLANVGYIPAKAVFAGIGAATSGVVYVATLGNVETARPIWDSSVRGNYVLTPSMIDGEQTIHFAG